MSNNDCMGILNELAEHEEKEAWFIERTDAHVARVKAAIEKIATFNPEFKEFDSNELLARAEIHDDSKYEEPERTPYIELTWRHKTDGYANYETPGQLEKDAENEATMHHILNNSHHPEFHNKEDANIDPENRDTSEKVIDVTNMPALDLAEMVADWQAMSEELQKNTAREWYESQKDVRWHFSEEQDAIISKVLAVFETDLNPVDKVIADKDNDEPQPVESHKIVSNDELRKYAGETTK